MLQDPRQRVGFGKVCTEGGEIRERWIRGVAFGADAVVEECHGDHFVHERITFRAAGEEHWDKSVLELNRR